MNLKETLQKYRKTVIVGFMSFSLILLSSMGLNVGSFLVESNLISNPNLLDNSPIYLSVIGLLLTIGLFLSQYLGEGNEFKGEILESYELDILNNNRVNEELTLKIEELRELIKNNQKNTLNDTQQKDLIAILKEKIRSEASESLLDEFRGKAEELIGRETKSRLEAHFERMMKRLSVEILELGKRAKVNLIIGSITAFSGVSIFMLFVFKDVSPALVESYLTTEFAPRISLVIVIEVFAYFFLGLYKNNLSEIKYFHNELTNIETKYMALEEALATADKTTIQEIVKEFSKTERNFLLKKGESTVSIEDKKITVEEQQGAINALLANLSNSKKS